MTNKELAELMYPNVTKTPEDYEKIYPERDLKEGAVITRFAPSPTGFVHMGSLLTAFIERKVPTDTSGVFFLRIEDTDQKRTIENGIQGIIDDLNNFDIKIDEGVISEDKEIGAYGPYIQTNRIDIYNTYAKFLVENDYAYPCFCTSEEIEDMRKNQEGRKERIGYYGKFAHCRYMSNDEKAKRIQNGDKYVLRLKSRGDFEKRVIIDDLVRGKIIYPENDIDHILIKSDGIPLYHFAHVIDDHLMRTTHVLRGEEWLPSTPIHIELFKMFGFKIPKYAHLGLVMKIDEEGTRRKLSKRKDKEAAVSYYHEKGIPIEAVKIYLMTIANSNFEQWYDCNKTSSLDDFKFDFKKVSASGTLFDLEKLLNISKNYISRLSAEEVYNNALSWATIYDEELKDLLLTNKEYSIKIFNIERCQKKPRKDYASYSDIKKEIWYMYDELYKNVFYDWQKINDKEEIKNILSTYLNKYINITDKEVWFNNIKLLCDELGYASNMKEYKENPDKFKGNVADVSTVLRVALTSRSMTPDLFEIMTLLEKDTIEKRFKSIYE